MSGNMSDWLKAKLLEHVYGGTTYTPPATIYIALFTVAPTSAGGGTECSGGGYTRKAVTNNTTNFPAVTGTSTKTSVLHVAQTMGPSSSPGWGTAVAWGYYDASSGGNFLGWADMNNPQTINTGASATIAVDALSMALTN